MIPAQFEPVAQLGAGPDGISYRARRRGLDAFVELRLLTRAPDDPVHWHRLERRLRLARLLAHPGSPRVLELDLDADPPWLALEWAEGIPFAKSHGNRVPVSTREGLARSSELAAILLAAHRVGLTHGTLSPETILVTAQPALLVDFTGTATRADQSRLNASAMGHFAKDVQALGAIVGWLVTGKPLQPGDAIPESVPTVVRGVLGDLLTTSTQGSPPLAEVAARLADAQRFTGEAPTLEATRMPPPQLAATMAGVDQQPERLGRFRVEQKLGQGGMGAVYRATDPSDGSTVAIKTLLPEYTRQPEMVRRFHKEARLLAEINNPYVANLLEVNEDEGIHYLVVEFVAGKSVASLLEEGGAIEERFTLAILADVCRALVVAHGKNVVHRDIKPENVLLVAPPGEAKDGEPIAKLSDFGLARHVVQSESLHLTRTGAILGTPLYLAPEQCAGEAADPRSDVYSAGATLFHLLAGRPPYLAETAMAVLQMHQQSPVPSLKAFAPTVSDGACRIVEKALAKSPAHRHADAAELLDDLERLRRGELAKLEVHPRLPATDPGRISTYEFTWELESSPAELWPYVSNTERLNRAIGLPAAKWTIRTDEQGKQRREGRLRPMGLDMAWREHPFEWVEGRRYAVLREFESGPFRWFVSLVELTARPDGGTTLRHRIQVEPSGLLGRAVAAVQLGVGARRSLDRVYRRIDAVVKGRAGTIADHFEEPATLPKPARRRLEDGLDRLARRGVDPAVLEQLGAFLATAPAQEVTRIRPLALAKRLGLDADATVAGCLHAAREGVLVLLWDLLCPICRVPSQVKETLKAVKDHGHCEACNLNYELDFTQSIELVFRADPTIREAETGVFCIGGPAHSPHVIAQVRLAPKEQVELNLALPSGAYRLRGPQLPTALEARVEAGPHGTRWEVDLARMAEKKGLVTLLRPGGQVLRLANGHDDELVVRLERAARREDALTAARVATLALFRELFPGELLSPGQLVNVASVTLLLTELTDLSRLTDAEGEGRAFAILHEHLLDVKGIARNHGGALVKAVGEGALLAFPEPVHAVRALLALEARDGLRAALHRGPARAATINEQLDYFGTTVRQTIELLAAAPPGEHYLSHEVMADPAVSALLRERAIDACSCHVELPGVPIAHRLVALVSAARAS